MEKSHKNTQRPAKVPIIMQMEALECGAASLAMILAYHGKWIPLEQVRKDCGVSRNGSNAKNIVLAARSYGLEAKAFRYEIDMLKEKGTFPCILFWNFCHFVVLDGFKKDKAVLNDPARGRIEISMEEFDENFTGICLFFEPSDTFQKDGHQKSLIGYVYRHLIKSRRALLFTVFTTGLSTLFGIIRPGFTRVFMDHLLTEKNPEWAGPFFALFAGLLALQIIVSFLSTNISSELSGKMAVEGSVNYLWRVLRLPMDFFSQRSIGEILNRQTLNASVAVTMVKTFGPMALQAMMLAFYLVIMMRYSVVLSLIGILTVILKIIIAQIVTQKRVNMIRVHARQQGRLASLTMSGLGMIETIKANGSEIGFFGQWAGSHAAANKENIDFTTRTRKYSFITSLVTLLCDALVTTLGLWFIMTGHYTVGMLAAFQGYLSSFMAPANNLITSGQHILEMRTNMERLDDVMQYPIDIPEEETELDSYQKLSGNLVINHVSFGYSPLDRPLIEDFNLDLKQGKSAAFVGRSGCGKSTLSRLISGLYKPWSGEILLDGKPIEDIDHRIMTGSLAVVDQDITIFADTIANNIKMWDESIEDFEMILAARDAQLHEDIMKRENGYRSVLQEGGKDLSGGQRQRLEIARVLAQDPTIVILDEATSALDARTEADVVKSITDRGITCIVIAHRLSTIRDCDEIIVLDKGRVVERGTHDELYALNGQYTALVQNE